MSLSDFIILIKSKKKLKGILNYSPVEKMSVFLCTSTEFHFQSNPVGDSLAHHTTNLPDEWEHCNKTWLLVLECFHQFGILARIKKYSDIRKTFPYLKFSIILNVAVTAKSFA